MEVEHVELIVSARNSLKQQRLRRDGIHTRTPKPDCMWDHGHELRTRFGITARKESYVMTRSDELFREPMHYALRAAVQLRRHALGERCDLRKSQRGVRCLREAVTHQ